MEQHGAAMEYSAPSLLHAAPWELGGDFQGEYLGDIGSMMKSPPSTHGAAWSSDGAQCSIAAPWVQGGDFQIFGRYWLNVEITS